MYQKKSATDLCQTYKSDKAKDNAKKETIFKRREIKLNKNMVDCALI